MATRVLSPQEINEEHHHPHGHGVSTQETNGVNALSYLTELMRPARSPMMSAVQFKPVPHNPSMRDRAMLQGYKPWKVFLVPSGKIDQALAVELRGDVILGSTPKSDAEPDINLANLDGFDKGVSRRHALLRPGRDRLYVIDLDSTNGTSINGLPAPAARAFTVQNGDLVTLGRLHLQIRIAQRPEPLIQH